MDLPEILQKTFHKYSTCSTYSDKGFYCDNSSGKPTIQFSTVFKRPMSVRFEWSGQTNITRQGFEPDETKSTVLLCTAEGRCYYFDPRNVEESELHFVDSAHMFREDSPLSGYVTDIILPFLISGFPSANPILGKKACLKMQKLNDDGEYAISAERTYKQYFVHGTTTFTDTIWIDDNLQIRRFKRQRILKSEDKRPSKFRKEVCNKSPQAYENYLKADRVSIDDYRFLEVSFDKDIDDTTFGAGYPYHGNTSLLMSSKI